MQDYKSPLNWRITFIKSRSEINGAGGAVYPRRRSVSEIVIEADNFHLYRLLLRKARFALRVALRLAFA